ncbi:hypothetical protein ACRYCC_06360 [Actinomadura scrupuli]|uniref:hypothetical protein n=1 Tax=Actinomadura scrupuli TaxID=559629 RepID=UPI003D991DF2
MSRSRTLISSAAIVGLALTGLATPAAADSFSYYRLDPLVFTPLLRGNTIEGLPGTECRYRVRYGNYGNLAFAQIRRYNSWCENYRVQVGAWQGNSFQVIQSGGSGINGSDGCGQYFELQATSGPGRIATRGTAVSGRPSPNRDYYHFHAAGYGSGGAIPSSLIVAHCDGS